eukprot:5273553-Pyramimonas_sp.AAC.1
MSIAIMNPNMASPTSKLSQPSLVGEWDSSTPLGVHSTTSAPEPVALVAANVAANRAPLAPKWR